MSESVDKYNDDKTKKGPLSAFSIIMVFILLSVVGIGLIPRLNISLVPSRSLPSVTVNFNWPNASARIIESRVTGKLEGLFSRMKGIENIESKTMHSKASITVSFEENINMDAARFQIASYIRQAYPKLPKEVSYPVLSVNNPDDEDRKLLSYAIYGSAPSHYIKKFTQDNIKSQITKIKGIHEVRVYGATPYEWFITYDPTKIQKLNISPQDIQKAIKEWFTTQNIAYVSVKQERQFKQKYRLRLKTGLKTRKAWHDIPVKKHKSRIIYLEDIAGVKFKKSAPSSYHRINGQNTVNMVVTPESRVNMLKLADQVKTQIASLQKTLPPGYSIRKMYDATSYINKEIRKVGIRAIIAVVVLLLFVLLISRQLKYLLLITITLVTNLAIAVIFYYATRLEIHIYSLAGMTISLGIIIDNSIIMTDHLRHHANKKAFLSILAATLTTIGALSLIFFLNQNQQLKLIDFSLIIIINLGVSLFIALFFIPSLLEKIDIRPRRTPRFIKRQRRIIKFSHIYYSWIRLQLKYKWIFVLLLVLAFGTPVYMLPGKIDNNTWGAQVYNSTLGSEWYKVHLKKWVNTYLGGSLRLFTQEVYEASFYSQPERTKLFVTGKMPEGSTIEQVNATFKKMEDYLSRFDEIDMYTTDIRNYRNARISIYFKEKYEKQFFPFILKGKLITKANNLGGMDWTVYGVGKAFNNAVNTNYKDSRIYVYGYNYEQLYRYAEKLKSELNKNNRVRDLAIRGESSWRAPPLRHKILVRLDEMSMSNLNFSSAEVYSVLKQKTMQPAPFGKLYINNQLQTVNIQSSNSDFDTWQLKHSPLIKDERMLKLSNAGKIEKVSTGNNIFKKNQEYRLAVEFNFAGPAALKSKVVDNHVDKMNNSLPLGYHAQPPHHLMFSQGKSSNKIWILAGILSIIFFICAILFESLKKPFVILSLVPMSFVGAFLTFYFFDINFDQGGYASFILLAGITVNSSLYIINEFNNQPARKNNVELYLKAFHYKIIPVLLTITSTILGLIPFLLGGQNEVFWFAFAAGSIGGLIFSLLGVFIFLPVFLLKKRHQ
ncbi:MAG: efflux RND transporter permease subunit [Bacteroidales bacterium]|nr:efflux RND transporter permease subunit [Bacteroidales bacterium]MCF8337076.1 efflux RND transporter permease subunit [Bacteroidales bacterium]